MQNAIKAAFSENFGIENQTDCIIFCTDVNQNKRPTHFTAGDICQLLTYTTK